MLQAVTPHQEAWAGTTIVQQSQPLPYDLLISSSSSVRQEQHVSPWKVYLPLSGPHSCSELSPHACSRTGLQDYVPSKPPWLSRKLHSNQYLLPPKSCHSNDSGPVNVLSVCLWETHGLPDAYCTSRCEFCWSNERREGMIADVCVAQVALQQLVFTERLVKDIRSQSAAFEKRAAETHPASQASVKGATWALKHIFRQHQPGELRRYTCTSFGY